MNKQGTGDEKLAEIRKSQDNLRENIAEAKRLSERSDELLRKHRGKVGQPRD